MIKPGIQLDEAYIKDFDATLSYDLYLHIQILEMHKELPLRKKE
jgi:hypothetical protein